MRLALAHREAGSARGTRPRCTCCGLADAAVLDAELGQRRDHRRLEVLGPVGIRAAGRRGHRGQRLADVLGPGRVDARPGPCGTGRSRPTTRCARQSWPRRRISSATRCGVITSRRLPRWIGPDGLSPEAQTIVLPGARRSASAMTSSANRETQSASALIATIGTSFLGNLTPPIVPDLRSDPRIPLSGPPRAAGGPCRSYLALGPHIADPNTWLLGSIKRHVRNHWRNVSLECGRRCRRVPGGAGCAAVPAEFVGAGWQDQGLEWESRRGRP